MAHFSIQKQKDKFRKQGIYHTNQELAQKVRDMLYKYASEPVTEIIDLCVGGGGLLSVFDDSVAKYGCDIEAEFIEYCKETQAGDFRVASCFSEPFGDRRFKHIVGNYPFSIKGSGAEMSLKFGGIYPYELANTLDSSFVLQNLKALDNGGVCVLVSSCGLFFRANKKESNFRKWLLEQNLITHTEIIPPNNHFDDTKISTQLIVLQKGRASDTFTYLDSESGELIEINRHEILKADDTYNLNRFPQFAKSPHEAEAERWASLTQEQRIAEQEASFSEFVGINSEVLEQSLKSLTNTIDIFKNLTSLCFTGTDRESEALRAMYRDFVLRAHDIISQEKKSIGE